MSDHFVILLCLLQPRSRMSLNPIYEASTKTVIAKVQSLAMNTSIHGSEEVYLAYIALPNNDRPMASLVDALSLSEKSIRTALVTQRRVLRMTFLRDTEHDITPALFHPPQDDSLLTLSKRRRAASRYQARAYLLNRLMHNKTRLLQINK